MDYSNQSYLAHYGIPGMKWGIRRFVDAAGRLTQAGLARMQRERRSQGVNSGYNIRKKTPGSVQDLMSGKAKKPKTEAEKKAQIEKAKKVIAVAGAITIGTIVAVKAAKFHNTIKSDMTEILKGKAEKEVNQGYDMLDEAFKFKGDAFIKNEANRSAHLARIKTLSDAQKILNPDGNKKELHKLMRNARKESYKYRLTAFKDAARASKKIYGNSVFGEKASSVIQRRPDAFSTIKRRIA